MVEARVRTALFVDFDNIYLGLRDEFPDAAEVFATDPDRWLRWIVKRVPSLGAPVDDLRRDVLVRRCYLNPQTFGRYRAYFTRSGFSVVDCPPLTTRGKNSSDIVMVMDIMDTLEHTTRFDEFILLSGDADFTPVLQRLRMHDRRTAVLVSGAVAPAYRAACDLMIPDEVFIEQALGVRSAPAPAASPAPVLAAPTDVATALLDAIAQRVYAEASSGDQLLAIDLPRIFREFPQFTPHSNWLGFFSLRGLTEALVARRPELRMVEGDPWRIEVRLAPAGGRSPEESAQGHPGGSGSLSRQETRAGIIDRIRAMVLASDEAVHMARAAQDVVRAFGPVVLESRWLGWGTFKDLLTSAPDFDLAIAHGYLYDPERHDRPAEVRPSDDAAGLPEPLGAFVRRVNRVTDAPRLTPGQYRMLFEVIAREVGRRPYTMVGTGKVVRDQLVERGEPIPQRHITYVLRGLGNGGYPLSDVERAHRAEEMALAFRGNVINLLRQAQVILSEAELVLLDEWLLAPPAPASDGGGSTEEEELSPSGSAVVREGVVTLPPPQDSASLASEDVVVDGAHELA